MSRYQNTRTARVNRKKVSEDKPQNILKYDTTMYNKVVDADNDLYIVTQDGDRLDNLAFQFYGNPSLWWFIAQTNNISTMNVPAGTSLRISFNTSLATGG